jgi:outer membrane immunogenic protein
VATSKVSSSATQTGWAAGAGIETKISPNWSLKGEYQFVDLGSVSTGPGPLVNAGAAIPGFQAKSSSSQVEFNTVRVGINYYFNAPPPPLPIK